MEEINWKFSNLVPICSTKYNIGIIEIKLNKTGIKFLIFSRDIILLKRNDDV